MSPPVMALTLLAGFGAFAWSARRRWKLMMIGAPERRTDRPADRIRATWKFAFLQLRMRRYPLAGTAHMMIFFGFLVLLLRSLILWGRGFDADFDMWIFGADQPLGKIYGLFKDTFVLLVLVGTVVFLYFRVVKHLDRMTRSTEALIILLIIFVMMLADIFYDGANIVEQARSDAVVGVALAPVLIPNPPPSTPSALETTGLGAGRTVVQIIPGETATDAYAFDRKQRGYMVEPDSPMVRRNAAVRFNAYEPVGHVAAMIVQGLSDEGVVIIKHLGFWTHVALVLIFLNILPYSKHFHVITAIPNVYAGSLHPPGRLPPLVDIEGKLEREETLGIKRIDQFSWKSILDFYTCTECGRCSDHCPATKTGKTLSPKHFTIDLRNFLYEHNVALTAPQSTEAEGEEGGNGDPPEHLKDLIDGVIEPEVLWACTTCRACEQECPVLISYVDKIIDMRRYLAQERGEFPDELQSAFRGLESSGNPWSYPADDRGAWAEGLDVKTMAENPDADVLLWVGCMPSYDERAKKVTRATVKLLQEAGVNFAILGNEETCTGDAARRAGNEYLFQMFAQQNVEVLNGYGVDKKTIVTACPHCFNTLKNEYPDFGGNYNVVHHTTFLADLIAKGKLTPAKRVDKKVVFHDSCYLGRYNDVYDAPRRVLSSVPGLTLLEPAETRDRGMCCGAGGAQMFKEEEQGTDRVSNVRTQQLLDTNPDAVASACPFCTRMLSDGLADKEREEVEQLDIAELLLDSIAPAEADAPADAQA